MTSDVDQMPGDIPVIQTYNKVKKVFPVKGVTATVVMEVANVQAGAPTTAIADLTNRVEKFPQLFRPGTELIESKDKTVAQINIPTIGSGNDQASLDALNKLRDDIVPATVGAVAGRQRQRDRRRRKLGGLQDQPEQPAAADLRVRVRAGVPAHARHVPLDRDPDQGDPAEPALGRERPTA